MCPGYRDDFDLVLRDQTHALQKGEKRKPSKKDITPGTSSITNNVSKTGVVQDRSTSPDRLEIVPSAFKVTPEELAVSSWFNSFILLYRDHESRRGYLEYLLPLYTSARHDSPLSLATSALSLIVFSGPPAHRPMMPFAQKVFGDSMALTRKALQHPVDSKNDQTLMAVLLLSMAEVCSIFGIFVGKASNGGDYHSSRRLHMMYQRCSKYRDRISRDMLCAFISLFERR